MEILVSTEVTAMHADEYKKASGRRNSYLETKQQEFVSQDKRGIERAGTRAKTPAANLVSGTAKLVSQISSGECELVGALGTHAMSERGRVTSVGRVT